MTTNNFLTWWCKTRQTSQLLADNPTYTIGTAYNGFRTHTQQDISPPTLYELYGADNFGYTGNPNLKAETSKRKEIGYNKIGSNYNFDIALYPTDTPRHDYISQSPHTQMIPGTPHCVEPTLILIIELVTCFLKIA